MADYLTTTEEIRTLVQGASAQEFDRWLAEVKREAKEEAWDEGFREGMYADWSNGNPYRDIS